jgi:hypothetical protein
LPFHYAWIHDFQTACLIVLMFVLPSTNNFSSYLLSKHFNLIGYLAGIIVCLRLHKMDWVKMLLFTAYMVLCLLLESSWGCYKWLNVLLRKCFWRGLIEFSSLNEWLQNDCLPIFELTCCCKLSCSDYCPVLLLDSVGYELKTLHPISCYVTFTANQYKSSQQRYITNCCLWANKWSTLCFVHNNK